MLTTANDVTKTDLQVGIECINLAEEPRLDNQGGYPADIRLARKLVIVASVDHDDAPELSIYEEQGIAELGAKVRKAIEDGEDEDQIHELIWDCLGLAEWKYES